MQQKKPVKTGSLLNARVPISRLNLQKPASLDGKFGPTSYAFSVVMSKSF
jgi:hypothetical protein